MCSENSLVLNFLDVIAVSTALIYTLCWFLAVRHYGIIVTSVLACVLFVVGDCVY